MRPLITVVIAAAVALALVFVAGIILSQATSQALWVSVLEIAGVGVIALIAFVWKEIRNPSYMD